MSDNPNIDAALAHEDELLKQLATPTFDAPAPVAPKPDPTPPVPALPVHAVDPDYQAVHAALQAGTIPTFADEPGANAAPAPSPLDVNAEKDAYAAILKLMLEHKSDGTTVTFMDPDDYAKSLI